MKMVPHVYFSFKSRDLATSAGIKKVILITASGRFKNFALHNENQKEEGGLYFLLHRIVSCPNVIHCCMYNAFIK